LRSKSIFWYPTGNYEFGLNKLYNLWDDYSYSQPDDSNLVKTLNCNPKDFD
jgi:hypothetical protein